MTTSQYRYLGAGVLAPLRRDGKGDFSNGVGIEVVESSLRVILGTLCAGPRNNGEVPFNQNLGCALKLLRHRNMDDPTTEELATHYVLEAIARNEPRVKVKSMGFVSSKTENKLSLRMTYDIVERGSSGINVVSSDLQLETEL
jgi:phage baseplate assembly protein W